MRARFLRSAYGSQRATQASVSPGREPPVRAILVAAIDGGPRREQSSGSEMKDPAATGSETARGPRSFRAAPLSSSFRLTLTERETEVLQLIADGLINKQIAQRLSLSNETIKAYIDNIRLKLDANNRAHAASLGLRHGLIE